MMLVVPLLNYVYTDYSSSTDLNSHNIANVYIQYVAKEMGIQKFVYHTPCT